LASSARAGGGSNAVSASRRQAAVGFIVVPFVFGPADIEVQT
jgi:hypothetical protein